MNKWQFVELATRVIKNRIYRNSNINANKNHTS